MQIPQRNFTAIIVLFVFVLVIPNVHIVDAHSNEDTIEPTSTLMTPARPSATDTIEPTETQIPPTVQVSTPTPTLTATNTSTPEAETTPSVLFAPLLYKQPSPPTPDPDIKPETLLFCNTQAISIPDNYPPGVTSAIQIIEPRVVNDIDVRVNLTHSWIGDLEVTLTQQETSTSVKLIERPGNPASDLGCDKDNIVAILDDEITLPVENKCASISPAITGTYLPNEPLQLFDGKPLSGNWLLTISDNNRTDVGQLNDWCIAAIVYDILLKPTPPPIPPPIPIQAYISGVTGKPQALPLDCESRSAVDWANFFGVYINEFTFFNNLPKSDNPDAGFVGSVYGSWGQIPPAPYGVHAEPVAELLRNYGLSSYTQHPLSWDNLRSEIAAGRPVIVWIVGSVINGIPVYYSTSDAHVTVVAPYEHTVIVMGYSETSVTYLNGSTIYSRSIEQFLDSWSVMGNMALTARP